MRFPEAFDGTFGQAHLGAAPASDPRRRRRLARLADPLLAHPAGARPDKTPGPYRLDAAYRLSQAGEVTRPAALDAHRRLTAAARPSTKAAWPRWPATTRCRTSPASTPAPGRSATATATAASATTPRP
jgi:hypothetical protein